MPHRDRRRLDQPGERVERLCQFAALVVEPRDLVLRLGGVEQPEQHRAVAQRCRSPPAHHQHAPAADRPQRTRERPAGASRGLDVGGQRGPVLGLEPGHEFRDRHGGSLEPEPVGDPCGRVKIAVGGDQHRQRRGGRQHRAQPRQFGGVSRRAACPRHTPHHRRQRTRQPQSEHDARKRGGERIERHRPCLERVRGYGNRHPRVTPPAAPAPAPAALHRRVPPPARRSPRRAAGPTSRA